MNSPWQKKRKQTVVVLGAIFFLLVVFIAAGSGSARTGECKGWQCFSKKTLSSKPQGYWPLQNSLGNKVQGSSTKLTTKYKVQKYKSPGKGQGALVLSGSSDKPISLNRSSQSIALWVQSKKPGTLLSLGARGSAYYSSLSLDTDRKLRFEGQAGSAAWLCLSEKPSPKGWFFLALDWKGSVYMNGDPTILCPDARWNKSPIQIGSLSTEKKIEKTFVKSLESETSASTNDSANSQTTKPAPEKDTEEADDTGGAINNSTKTETDNEGTGNVSTKNSISESPATSNSESTQESAPEEQEDSSSPGSANLDILNPDKEGELTKEPEISTEGAVSVETKTVIERTIGNQWQGAISHLAVWENSKSYKLWSRLASAINPRRTEPSLLESSPGPRISNPGCAMINSGGKLETECFVRAYQNQIPLSNLKFRVNGEDWQDMKTKSESRTNLFRDPQATGSPNRFLTKKAQAQSVKIKKSPPGGSKTKDAWKITARKPGTSLHLLRNLPAGDYRCSVDAKLQPRSQGTFRFGTRDITSSWQRLSIQSSADQSPCNLRKVGFGKASVLLTNILVEKTTKALHYPLFFDGNTTGARWNGAPNNSSSTLPRAVLSGQTPRVPLQDQNDLIEIVAEDELGQKASSLINPVLDQFVPQTGPTPENNQDPESSWSFNPFPSPISARDISGGSTIYTFCSGGGSAMPGGCSWSGASAQPITWRVHQYTSVGANQSFSVDRNLLHVQQLVVGGGGAGGGAGNNGGGGGGGAGGVIYTPVWAQSLNSGNYTVTVGAAGVPGPNATNAAGGQGGLSGFSGFGAFGALAAGGGGGGQSTGSATASANQTGGSGAGGGATVSVGTAGGSTSCTAASTITFSQAQVNTCMGSAGGNGGVSSSRGRGGGGGGAARSGGTGSNASGSVGGNGGLPLIESAADVLRVEAFTNNVSQVAGGGGGGARLGTAGSGNSCGGNGNTAGAGLDATCYGGGGGGGAGTGNAPGTSQRGGYGKEGIVFLRYPVSPFPVTNPTSSESPASSGQFSITSDGTWEGFPVPTLTYQWYRCDTTASTSCTAISGATSSTYKATASDLNKYIWGTVVGTNTYRSWTAYTTISRQMTTWIPINNVAPSISGTLTTGSTLSASNGTWSAQPAISSYSYQWKSCTAASAGTCTSVGTNSSTYTLQGSDYGKYIEVEVTATNTTGSSSMLSSRSTVVGDTTAPSGGSVTVPSAYNGSGSFDLDFVEYTDSGSGIKSIGGNVIQPETRSITSGDGVTTGTCSSTGWSNSGSSADVTNSVSPLAIAGMATGCYRYKLTGTDNANNTSSTTSGNIIVDRNPPSTPTPTISSDTGSTHIAGTVVYINPQSGKSGGFTVSATPTDSESGIEEVVFPSPSGISGGGGDVSSPFSATYSWSGAVAASGSQTITASNRAQLTSTSNFTVTPDTTPPSGGALTVNGTAASGGGTSSNSASGQFNISRTDFTDSGSDMLSSVLTRASASLVANCSTASYGSSTELSGAPSQTLSDGCYRYILTGTDNVDNVVTLTTFVRVEISVAEPPVNITPPDVLEDSVVGARVGRAQGSDPGTWTGADSFAYQWQSSEDGTTWSDVSGATNSTFTPGSNLGNKYLRVCVEGINEDGSDTVCSDNIELLPSPAIDFSALSENYVSLAETEFSVWGTWQINDSEELGNYSGAEIVALYDTSPHGPGGMGDYNISTYGIANAPLGGSGGGSSIMELILENLSPDTTYYISFFLALLDENGDPVDYISASSGELSFVTTATRPYISSGNTVEVGANGTSAEISFSVASPGSLPEDAQVGVAYGTDETYSDGTEFVSATAGSNSVTISNLVADTTYYFIPLISWDEGASVGIGQQDNFYTNVNASPPSTGAISCSGTEGTNEWYTSNITCQFEASGTENITAAQFEISSGTSCSNWGSPQTATLGSGSTTREASKTFSDEGTFCIRASASAAAGTTDAGNRSTKVIRIDKTNPSISAVGSTPSSPASGQVQFGSSSVTDSVSGPDNLTIQSSPAGANTWSNLAGATCASQDVSSGSSEACTWSTIGNIADGEYDLRLLVSDQAGRTSTQSLDAKPGIAGTTLWIRNSIAVSGVGSTYSLGTDAPVAPISGTTGSSKTVTGASTSFGVLAGGMWSPSVCVPSNAASSRFRSSGGETLPDSANLELLSLAGNTLQTPRNTTLTQATGSLCASGSQITDQSQSPSDESFTVGYRLKQDIPWTSTPQEYTLPLLLSFSQIANTVGE